MPLPVRHCRGVVGVGVAVVAEVGTGVVFADVLGHDAAAGGDNRDNRDLIATVNYHSSILLSRCQPT